MNAFSFRPAPSYRAASPDEQMTAAFDMPMSLLSTLGQQAKGGILDSFGLGAAVRTVTTPETAPVESGSGIADTLGSINRAIAPENMIRRAIGKGYDGSPVLDEDKYKSSAYYRDGVKWDPGMTEDRAAALAESFDAKRVRDHFASKRPITAFLGNIAGQALDPINYIPIMGQTVKAANVARFGRVGGAAITNAIDAAANTALAGALTYSARKDFGDDITWQSTVSEIAMSALIGGAFGGVSGVLDSRRAARAANATAKASEALSTLKNVQDARIALNSAIDGLVRGEDVAMPAGVADRLNVVTDEIRQKMDAVFNRPRVEPGEMAITPDQIDRVTNETVHIPAKGRAPQTLFDFIASRGGIKEDGGELAAMGVNRKFVPGRGALVRKNGLALDKAREAAAEAGFFDHLYGNADEATAKSTVADFLDLVDQENRGNPVYSSQDAGRVESFAAFEKAVAEREEFKRFISELSDTLNEIGIGVKVDDDVLRRATTYMASDNLKPLDAFDKAVLEDEARFAEFFDEYRDASQPDNRPAAIPFFGDEGGFDGQARGVLGTDGQVGQGQRAGNVADSGELAGRGRVAEKASLDTSTAKPEPLPAGRAEAEARVATPENYKAASEQYGVNADDGTFIEQADVDQMRNDGRLTPDDEAALVEAETTYENGVSYGEALKAVVGCLLA